MELRIIPQHSDSDMDVGLHQLNPVMAKCRYVQLTSFVFWEHRHTHTDTHTHTQTHQLYSPNLLRPGLGSLFCIWFPTSLKGVCWQAFRGAPFPKAESSPSQKVGKPMKKRTVWGFLTGRSLGMYWAWRLWEEDNFWVGFQIYQEPRKIAFSKSLNVKVANHVPWRV